MLGFHPAIYIDYDWTSLTTTVTNLANGFVKNGKYREYVLYEDGASVVSKIPGDWGWISKSNPSEDFFVMGGTTETEELESRFKSALPELTFTPATVCYSSHDVPRHRDNIKNGQASLVYPLHPCDSVGVVYDPGENNPSDFYYSGRNSWPTVINITQYHRVYNTQPRVWFSIHFHEPIETVKQVFDTKSLITI
jgi:hypothetical protein